MVDTKVYPEDGASTFLRNDGNSLTVYAALPWWTQTLTTRVPWLVVHRGKGKGVPVRYVKVHVGPGCGGGR